MSSTELTARDRHDLITGKKTKATSRAQARAFARLRDQRREEYRVLYREELAKAYQEQGLTPDGKELAQ
jgi:hypothetical protein